MKRYGNRQANRGAGSCLQGGVLLLWLLDKPPATGIKLPPLPIAQPADTRYKDLCGGEGAPDAAPNAERRNSFRRIQVFNKQAERSVRASLWDFKELCST